MIPLILYDIPSKLEGNHWSPNTAKPRFVLGYKGLPFRVEWVEYPDIAPRMKEIGARQNKLADGRDLYTLPVLSDPNTGALITDSWDIAEYLEKTYPEKPIFSNKSKGLIRAFDTTVANLEKAAVTFRFLRVSQILNEHSVEYFITTKEALAKEKISEFSPEGPRRDEHWAIIERAMETCKEWYDSEEGKWLMGDVFSYADILLASRLFCFKRVLHDDEWEKFASWHGERWGTLLADVEKECNGL
ncbi:hypothetical protein BKA82DRAFT_1007545 [Pisolithus tinctorius]|uniref:GST N-terminal domain-containing protein n=1 Tax=Pisolithus tinctorius Marx 270 TaxID=870435 RepID=A0A0C3IEF2_PISTI|nr:hypothetical protein BKA82DRAFT_1007545 [Pisolithus tinctorius]KIN95407.1 hypothetical protein M404DRAFT_1007545 [Pisolithus tinctorius Marx 270]